MKGLLIKLLEPMAYNPKSVTVEYFHSNGSAKVVYKNSMNQIVVYNGQSREKNLKLMIRLIHYI